MFSGKYFLYITMLLYVLNESQKALFKLTRKVVTLNGLLPAIQITGPTLPHLLLRLTRASLFWKKTTDNLFTI